MKRDVLETLLRRFRLGKPAQVRPMPGGKIHTTLFVQCAEGPVVVQKLAPPFDHRTVLDSHALTQYLIRQGFPVPPILLTDTGEPYYRDHTGVYRVMRYMPGTMKPEMDTPETAETAGRTVGRLHGLLESFEYEPLFRLDDFNNPPAWLEKLECTAAMRPDKAGRVKDLRERFRRALPEYLLPTELPRRRIHGDLKAANFLWNEHGGVAALVDFDTFATGAYPMEMADAFRSWCGRKTGPLGPHFRTDLLSAGWNGYLHTAPAWEPMEREALTLALPLMFLQLGMRYLIDYFEERFFSWDPERYATRADHNLARAYRQWLLFEDLTRRRHEWTYLF